MAASTNVPDAPVVSPERVAAFRLSRHHLVERAPASALARVAGDMAGTQAQVLSAAQMSLAARTRDISVKDVEQALWRDRTLVKTWCMRGALHLIPSKDFAVFVRGSRRDARSTAWMVRRGFPIDAVDRLVRGMRTEIAERVSASLGVKVLAKSGRGWGGKSNATGFRIAGTVLSLDGIVFLACTRGLACFGPSRGAEATFVRPEEWIRNWEDRPAEQAELELLRRYLGAHGPATVRDFAQWTYMTAADARGIWGHLEAELAPVNIGRQVGWVLRDDVPALKRAKLESTVVRLLPNFDSFLLGVKDKSHLVDAAHYKRVYRPQGWLSPVVLLDGRIAGVWSYNRKRRRLEIRVEAFQTLRSADRAAIRDEAEELRRFLDAPEVAVAFAKA